MDIISVNIATDSVDSLAWVHHKSGVVTSKAAYEICRNKFPEVSWGKWIWAKHIPPTRSTFVWRLIWSKVPTWEVQQSHGIEGPSMCVFCYREAETTNHIFSSCSFASKIISAITGIFGVDIDSAFGFHDSFLQIISVSLSPKMLNLWKMAWITFYWMIWKARNTAKWDGTIPCLNTFLAQLRVFIVEAGCMDLGWNFNSILDLNCVAALGSKFA